MNSPRPESQTGAIDARPGTRPALPKIGLSNSADDSAFPRSATSRFWRAKRNRMSQRYDCKPLNTSVLLARVDTYRVGRERLRGSALSQGRRHFSFDFRMNIGRRPEDNPRHHIRAFAKKESVREEGCLRSLHPPPSNRALIIR